MVLTRHCLRLFQCNRLSGVVFASSAASSASSSFSSERITAAATNYFDILGVEVSYLLLLDSFISIHAIRVRPHNIPLPRAIAIKQSFLQSPSELKAKYKSLMTKFHPDRHHASTSSTSLSSEKEQEEVRSQMATMATDVTRAYSVLEDPLSRSLHLLELGGEAISESDRVRTRRSIFISSSLTQFVSHLVGYCIYAKSVNRQQSSIGDDNDS